MFGKPEWFVVRASRRGVRPAGWRGWLFNLGVLAATLVPALVLLAARGIPEAAIWVAASGVFWWWNARRIERTLRSAEPVDADVLYITDDAESPPVTTKSYELQMK